MSDKFYVATGRDGVEHTAVGPVRWTLPDASGNPTVAESGRSLALRRTGELLDVLEAEIYEAEPLGEVATDRQGVVAVSSARLVRHTKWDSKTATMFAISCAAHAVDARPEAKLPDGTALSAILEDARRAVEGVSDGGVDRLDYWARVRALRRMRHDRDELADQSRELAYKDEARDVDALDDLGYASVISVTDAVLAAIEALRHQLLPHLYTHFIDNIEESLEAENLDRQTPLGTPTITATPFGPSISGAPPELPYDPAWTGAREAARHARQAADDRGGASAEAEEAAWQAGARRGAHRLRPATSRPVGLLEGS